MTAHDGHRLRMRKRFLDNGLEGFHDHEILELLLFYCIPRKDTNEIAHRLCARFGSFPKVLDASVRELEKVDGIGENAACFLSLIREVNKYYQTHRYQDNRVLMDTNACGAYIQPFFATEKNEAVYLLCLDAKCMVLSCRKVAEGSVNSANISARRIVDMALAENATSVILAHNHPSGIAMPSVEDIQTTDRIAKALCLVDVNMVDHIIVADDDYVSMAQSGCYSWEDICKEMKR